VIVVLIVLAVVAGGAFWWLTRPRPLDAGTVSLLGTGDAVRGEHVFWAGGCASCHARPGAKGDAQLELAGGLELKTRYGVFVAPNISPDRQDGIGGWSVAQFANAVMAGVTPQGTHLYPAFPYKSYARMKPADVADLFAYLHTLPAVKGKAADNKLRFPFDIRRGVGLWKMLYLDSRPVVTLAADASAEVRRGQYLVEGPGHCGECHTPRDAFGGLDKSRWLAGAIAPEGSGPKGRDVVPNITGGQGGIGEWSQTDIAYFLQSGFTPDFDSVGGSMVEVQENMAHLSDDDRMAIAAYLKAVPPHPNGYPPRANAD
jgi:mono/diheme cytochrome c family protein